ncbi:MAG TPA: hypothetical protein VKB48_06135 [Candidatus Acidoferrum sp.]|jgi:hypothetical protein|nr:hypothetical protein [Candidatus Acidoferrum sp.]
MKAPLKYKEFAKPAVCFGLVIGMLLPLVSCRKAEEKVKEEAAYLVGMEEYVYGYPLAMGQ